MRLFLPIVRFLALTVAVAAVGSFVMTQYFKLRVKLAATARSGVGVSSVRTLVLGLFFFASLSASDSLTRLRYNNPGLTVDLGVGLWAWPLPMDYDGDGDLDLVVSSGGKPYQGTYFFENPSRPGEPEKMPVFKPGVRIADYRTNVQISQVRGRWRVLTPGEEHPAFLKAGFQKPKKLSIDPTEVHQAEGRLRARQWKLADWEGDGDLDLVIGIGDWTDYGWDNAFNEKGEWTQGPLHGWVYRPRFTR